MRHLRLVILCALCLFLVMALLLWRCWSGWGMVWMSFRGRRYLLRDHPGRMQVAELLAALEARVERLLARLRNGPDRAHAKVQQLMRRWGGSLSETPVTGDQPAGFTENKRSISVCIRSACGAVQDQATAFYVVLHELAHLATTDMGHEGDFRSTFRYLLKQAIEEGVYEYQAFEREPQTYCGVLLDNSDYSCVLAGTCAAEL